MVNVDATTALSDALQWRGLAVTGEWCAFGRRDDRPRDLPPP